MSRALRPARQRQEPAVTITPFRSDLPAAIGAARTLGVQAAGGGERFAIY